MSRSSRIAPMRLLVMVLAALLAFSPLAAMAAPAAQFGGLAGASDAAAPTGTPQLWVNMLVSTCSMEIRIARKSSSPKAEPI